MSTTLMPIYTYDLNCKMFRDFAKLYTDYIHELSVYSERIKREEVTDAEIELAWLNPDLRRYFVNQGKDCIGFLLIGINENKHESSNWFIAEFYIAKEYQGKGIGKKAIRDLLGSKKGAYCLFILEENKRALCFWDKTFSESGYIDTTEFYSCDCAPNDCVFKMYEPKDSISPSILKER